MSSYISEGCYTRGYFSGVKPYVDNIRVFGSLGYVYTPFDKRTKLEATSKRCVFVGYSDEYKFFRIFVPMKGKPYYVEMLFLMSLFLKGNLTLLMWNHR